MDEAVQAIVEEFAAARARAVRALREAKYQADKECWRAKDRAWEKYKRAIEPVLEAYEHGMTQAKAACDLEEKAK